MELLLSHGTGPTQSKSSPNIEEKVERLSSFYHLVIV